MGESEAEPVSAFAPLRSSTRSPGIIALDLDSEH